MSKLEKKMIEIPITLTTYASIKINDQSVMDLSRGDACYGHPFDDKNHLLQHLAINLIGERLNILNMDGFADLNTNSVEVQVDDKEADIHHSLIRKDND